MSHKQTLHNLNFDLWHNVFCTSVPISARICFRFSHNLATDSQSHPLRFALFPDDARSWPSHRVSVLRTGAANALPTELRGTGSAPHGVGPGEARRAQSEAGAGQGPRCRSRRGGCAAPAGERSGPAAAPSPRDREVFASLCCRFTRRRSKGEFGEGKTERRGTQRVPGKRTAGPAGRALTKEIWRVPISLGFCSPPFSPPLLFKLSHC